MILIGLLPFILVNKYRCVVATDRRLLVLDAGQLATTKPKSVIRALPRSTRIGPFSGTLWYVSGNLGETLRIHKRFQKDMEAADAAAPGAGTLPPPPPRRRPAGVAPAGKSRNGAGGPARPGLSPGTVLRHPGAPLVRGASPGRVAAAAVDSPR